MIESNMLFIEKLLKIIPELQSMYEEHIVDNKSLLPHVFMGNVTRFIVAKAQNNQNKILITNLLRYIEDGLKNGSPEVKELIIVSFVENLIGETETLKALKPLMGLNMKSKVESLCEKSGRNQELDGHNT